jgi:hypothetical protein
MTLDSSGKDLNRWLKGVIMTYKNCCRKAGWLAILRRRRGGCKGNQPVRFTLGCSTILGHHGGIWVVWFG